MAKRNQPQKDFWPSWRYGPFGESAIFQRASDVPEGWARRPQDAFIPTAPVHLDRNQLADQLRDKGITPLGHWSASYMKELLDR